MAMKPINPQKYANRVAHSAARTANRPDGVIRVGNRVSVGESASIITSQNAVEIPIGMVDGTRKPVARNSAEMKLIRFRRQTF